MVWLVTHRYTIPFDLEGEGSPNLDEWGETWLMIDAPSAFLAERQFAYWMRGRPVHGNIIPQTGGGWFHVN